MAQYWVVAHLEQGHASGRHVRLCTQLYLHEQWALMHAREVPFVRGACRSHKWRFRHVRECLPLVQMELCIQACTPAAPPKSFPLPPPPRSTKPERLWTTELYGYHRVKLPHSGQVLCLADSRQPFHI